VTVSDASRDVTVTSQPVTRAAPVAAVVGLLALLAAHESGGRLYSTAYRDPAGIPTVCDGITGPDVIEGKTYSREECDAITRRYVDRMNAAIGHCIAPAALTVNEWIAWGDFSYNVGTSAFCGSTAAKRLREGRKAEACAQMTQWRFVKINGKPRDCALPQWRPKCGGIVTRRETTREICERDL
jgi:lysozyme